MITHGIAFGLFLSLRCRRGGLEAWGSVCDRHRPYEAQQGMWLGGGFTAIDGLCCDEAGELLHAPAGARIGCIQGPLFPLGPLSGS